MQRYEEAGPSLRQNSRGSNQCSSLGALDVHFDDVWNWISVKTDAADLDSLLSHSALVSVDRG